MRQLYRKGPLMVTDNVLHVGNRYWYVRDIEAAFIRKQNGIVYRIGVLFWGLFLLLGYFTFLSPAYRVAILDITLPMDGQEMAFGVCVLCGFTICILNLLFPRKFLIILTSTGEWPVLFSRRCVRLLGAWHAVEQVLHQGDAFMDEEVYAGMREDDDGVLIMPHQRDPREKYIRAARKIGAPDSQARRFSVRATTKQETSHRSAQRYQKHS